MSSYTKKFIGIISAFLILIIISGMAWTKIFRPELVDENLAFQSELVVNNQIDVEVQHLDSYNNGKAGIYYYIFTDKGRLLVNNEGFSFDHDLYKEFESKKGMVCTVKVNDHWFNGWEVVSIINC